MPICKTNVNRASQFLNVMVEGGRGVYEVKGAGGVREAEKRGQGGEFPRWQEVEEIGKIYRTLRESLQSKKHK